MSFVGTLDQDGLGLYGLVYITKAGGGPSLAA
jgi:hypothetical protein